MFLQELLYCFVLILSYQQIYSTALNCESPQLSPKKLVSIDDIIPSEIKCVLSDMDGTLLKSDHSIGSRTITTIKKIKEKGIPFFPTTGRSRKSFIDVTGSTFDIIFGSDKSKIPGVYSQGLVVYGPNGELIYERFLDNNVIEIAEQFCELQKISVIAYAGDEIYCKKASKETNKITQYEEPIPLEFPDGLNRLLEKKNIKINKLILLDTDEVLISIRPKIENLLNGIASFTTSVPGMLEILPFGSNKGDGVKRLLDHISISPENTVAFGDGENDMEMLQIVKYGIAVENGKEKLKEVAYKVTLSNNEEGVAHVLEMIL